MAILESHLADRLRKSMQNQCLGFDEAVGATATNSPAGVPRLRYPCRWFGRRDARPGGVVPIYEGKGRAAGQRFGSRPVQMGPNWE